MKKYASFFAGMIVMISVLALSGTALAASGQLQISNAGLVILDAVSPWTANGFQPPSLTRERTVSPTIICPRR